MCTYAPQPAAVPNAAAGPACSTRANIAVVKLKLSQRVIHEVKLPACLKHCACPVTHGNSYARNKSSQADEACLRLVLLPRCDTLPSLGEVTSLVQMPRTTPAVQLLQPAQPADNLEYQLAQWPATMILPCMPTDHSHAATTQR
jgi:hypothetical protein